MEKITSNQNSRVKDWKKMQTKKGRVKSGQYVIEGWHIVDEAIRHRQTIKELMVVDESYLGALPVDDTTQVFIITQKLPNIFLLLKLLRACLQFSILKTTTKRFPMNFKGLGYCWIIFRSRQHRHHGPDSRRGRP